MGRAALPGVRVGPLDPDATESFGQVSGRTSARQLIRTHAAMHPPVLTAALSKKLDEERTQALLLSEVSDVLNADGDLLPEDSVLEGAQVRGERDRPQLLTFTFRVPSGRTAKGFTEYDERFAKSVERGDEAVKIAELRKTGLLAVGPGQPQDSHVGTARAEAAERQAAGLRAENDELRKRLEERGTAEGGGKTAEQERQESADGEQPDDDYDEWTLGELRDALAKDGLEDTVDREVAIAELRKVDAEEGVPEADGEPPTTDASGADEPVNGYSEFNAEKAKAAIKEADEQTARAILDYEKQVGKRTTVVSAAEHRIDELAKAHQKPNDGS